MSDFFYEIKLFSFPCQYFALEIMVTKISSQVKCLENSGQEGTCSVKNPSKHKDWE